MLSKPLLVAAQSRKLTMAAVTTSINTASSFTSTRHLTSFNTSHNANHQDIKTFISQPPTVDSSDRYNNNSITTITSFTNPKAKQSALLTASLTKQRQMSVTSTPMLPTNLAASFGQFSKAPTTSTTNSSTTSHLLSTGNSRRPSTSPHSPFLDSSSASPIASAPSSPTNKRSMSAAAAVGHGEPLIEDHLAAASAKHAVVEDYFGVNSFSPRTLADMVDATTYQQWHDAIVLNKPLPVGVADVIANALRKWAQARGATHFSHWFHPLTGGVAEKHDTFIDTKKDGTPISRFEGKHLIRCEPDGSSFPTGGLRATHAARAYTAWDPSSPPFILENGVGHGATLYIPAILFSWKDNHALDDKTPLLRSISALTNASLELMHTLEEKEHSRVHTDSGIEQEFFLIDRNYFLKRPDLQNCGRALLGARPSKGQELEDQYFGIPSQRTLNLIHDFEIIMWKLGVPIQTRHREVAPGQYEIAPKFAESNIAGDRNMLLMEVLRRVARKHNMTVLFHEKPFAGVNGSGKHNNWSFGTNKIPSLLAPGDHPASNLHFMLFLAATLRAVDLHADLLRVAIATAGNDHRLGANEAPPAIVSAYLGDDIEQAVEHFILHDSGSPRPIDLKVDLGIPFLPPLDRAPTDRNRTSSFAFTGNKFEFRAVGSAQNPSRSNTVLNTILSESIHVLNNEIKILKGKGLSVGDAMRKVARETLVAHRRIIFNGDGYSKEWPIEAARRGIPNLRSTPDALETFATEKNIKLFESLGVLTRAEVEARSHVYYEDYVKRICVEGRTLTSMVITGVVPAAIEYQTKLATSVALISANDEHPQHRLLTQLNHALASSIAAVEEVKAALGHVHEQGSIQRESRYCEVTILPAMLKARNAVDELELLMPANSWPFPTYQEMLFHQD